MTSIPPFLSPIRSHPSVGPFARRVSRQSRQQQSVSQCEESDPANKQCQGMCVCGGRERGSRRGGKLSRKKGRNFPLPTHLPLPSFLFVSYAPFLSLSLSPLRSPPAAAYYVRTLLLPLLHTSPPLLVCVRAGNRMLLLLSAPPIDALRLPPLLDQPRKEVADGSNRGSKVDRERVHCHIMMKKSFLSTKFLIANTSKLLTAYEYKTAHHRPFLLRRPGPPLPLLKRGPVA